MEDSETRLTIKVVGGDTDSFPLSVSDPLTTTVSSLKRFIEKHNSTLYPVVAQRLIFKGQILKDEKFLSEYQINSGCAIHLTMNKHILPSLSFSFSHNDFQRYLAEMQRESPTQWQTALSTLLKICDNIIDHPQDPKFRRLRLSNQALQNRLYRAFRARECLVSLGFEEGKEEDHLVLSASAENWDAVKAGKRIIEAQLSPPATDSLASQLNPLIAQAFQNPSMLSQSLEMLQRNPALMQRVSGIMQGNPNLMQQVSGIMQGNSSLMQQVEASMQRLGNTADPRTSTAPPNTPSEIFDENEIADAIAQAIRDQE